MVLAVKPVVGAACRLKGTHGGSAFGPVAARRGWSRAVMPMDLAARAYQGWLLRTTGFWRVRFDLLFAR